ncbi:MAG TPA: SPFH domain-containing protein [Anaerolineales bacterium]|jgi:hypothetical protein
MDEQTSFFKHFKTRLLMSLAGFVVFYLVIGWLMNFFGVEASHSWEILADVIIFVLGMLGWMVFFAQFVLPVSTLEDRWKVVDRLVTYLMGGHGPAIFIENGYIQSREGERKQQGPGLIWLDSASAALLRTAVEFRTPAIGPGVHFTNGDEYIAATVDLHTLSQSIGPNDSDEPFKIQETDPNYKAVKERAELTNALTRDGIIVSAAISVSFRIKSTPGEGNTRFGFNPANTEADIRDSMIRGADLNYPVWNTLPARMAADLWREYLGKFRLSELFENRENQSETTIQFLNDMIKKRLTRPQVEVLDEFGKLMLESPAREGEYLRLLRENNRSAAENLLKKAESTEFAKLTQMGLEVKGVSIRKLFFSPDIEEQLINQWTALWLKNAQKEKDQVELDRKLWTTTGEQEGLKDFALMTSREIARQSSTSPAHALEMLVHSVFRGVQRNPALFKNINTEEQRDLSKIFSWLRNLRGSSE